MEVSSAYDRLEAFVEFIKLGPTREQIVVYLSEHADPYGEVCGVNTSFLDDGGIIKREFSFGLRDVMPLFNQDVSMHADHPAAEIFRTMRPVFVNLRELYERYTEITFVAELHDYAHAVAFSTTTKRSYAFFFSSDITEFPNYKDYFLCIRSLLSLWELMSNPASRAFSKSSGVSTDKLTQRQELIVTLINENKTNASIASILGYSESLIRQETIIIYKKLGVSGRKELMELSEVKVD